jgi:hypothetical protein
MKRKLFAAWAVLGALVAFSVAPATASAVNDPDLTYPTGTMLAKGTAFKGVNIGETRTTTLLGTATSCSSAGITGTLRKNNGSEVEADVESLTFSGTGTNGICTFAGSPEFDWVVNPAVNGLPWCLRSTPSMKDDEVQIRGGACGGIPRPIRMAFLTTFTTEGGTDTIECVYERTAAIVGTYRTHPEEAIVTFSEAEFLTTTSGFACPSAWKLDLPSFTLERDEASANPFYIS